VQRIVVWFAINQNQIGPQVTIAVVLPLAPKGVIAMPHFEQFIVCKRPDQRLKILKEEFTVRAFRFAFEISFESGSLLNLSH